MRRSLLLLLLFILASAALNLPLALRMQRSRQAPTPTLVNDFGPAAAARQWPAVTPHASPWPVPDQWQAAGNAGYQRINVYATATDADGRVVTTFNMQLEQMGWPLPALERVQMWWPWDDPAWKITADSDPPLRLAWPGALLNPLLIGTALWIVFVLPVQGFFAVRRRRRTRVAGCQHCGYPRGTSEVCTECGEPLVEPAPDS